MSTYNYRKLEWDTNYFGCESSRVEVVDILTVKNLEEIKRLIEEDEFVTITNSKGMVDNNKTITQELGAYLVDINIQLTNSKVNEVLSEKSELIYIANNYEYNVEIVELAEQAFTNSRFYNDSMINRDKVSGVYTNWVKNAFNKQEKYFCVYDQESDIEGFILFSVAKTKEVTIELIAVNSKCRKSGIGTQLINRLYQYCNEQGYKTVHVGTQVENINALNFYTKNELEIRDIKYIYHLWQ